MSDENVSDVKEEPMKDEGLEKMEVETSMKESSWLDSDGTSKHIGWFARLNGVKGHLPRKYNLVTDEDALQVSIRALRYIVLASAVNTKLLNPNYAIMVSPGAHEDSFESTEPFDFNSATYFIPFTALFGVAITSIFAGKISDKVGRKRVLWICNVAGGIGSIVKYIMRRSFWGFCIANFLTGLFTGQLPVAMAYIGDVFTSKKEKDEQLGTIMGMFVMGNSGGGVIAILMDSTGLFTPLWVGAIFMFVAAAVTTYYLIEPGEFGLLPVGPDKLQLEEEEEDFAVRPDTIDECAMWNVILGALMDNIGSTGLFPLCVSPLAFEQYYLNFVTQEPPQEPIMSLTGYKWLTTMVALLVVPSTLVTPTLFTKIGCAASAVFGNVCTGFVTMALLYIGNGPTTHAYFAAFVIVLYGGFPFTVVSQLTTGPMLDVLAPPEKIGYVQGLNNATMNFGMAFAPWLLGILADAAGTNTAIWTGIGISFFAAVCNSPLMLRKEFGPTKKVPPKSKRILPGEDSEIIEKVLRGEFVSQEELVKVNLQRLNKGQPAIIQRPLTYDEDLKNFELLEKEAQVAFKRRMERNDIVISELSKPERQAELPEFCAKVNAYVRADTELTDEVHELLGQWFAEHLKRNGYMAHTDPLIIKEMILSAFPPLLKEDEINPDNIISYLLNLRRVNNVYLKMHEKEKYTLTSVLQTPPVFFS